jgi:DNA primase large subunit
MISVTSITDKYILQPSLMAKHKKALDWLSTSLFWKKEMSFFQKLLDNIAPKLSAVTDKQRLDHFQHFITYYNGELVDSLRTKLRLHEKNLAEMLEQKDEQAKKYFQEHDELMGALEAANTQILATKEDLYDFVGRAMK